jgi:hypothetical protein
MTCQTCWRALVLSRLFLLKAEMLCEQEQEQTWEVGKIVMAKSEERSSKSMNWWSLAIAQLGIS